MNKLKILLTVSILLLIAVWVSSCRKDVLLTDSSAKLEFSEDTILFDTVFVTVGSTNKQLIVHNNHDRKINISSIHLKGPASRYRINVDGVPGISFNNVEIEAKDSIYIFVEVTVDPNSNNLPFVLTDTIEFVTNGNTQDVALVAWGQNAHFFHPTNHVQGLPDYSIIPCNATWDSILPYVIYGYAVVDSGCCLTIKEGTKVYFYNSSGLWVYIGGCLNVDGTKGHPVTFQGTRLESYYAETPNQWDRIWINQGSSSNVINYAVIKNGFIGLQLEELPDPNSYPKHITVNNTIIKNMNGVGVLTRNYDADFNNCVITNCGSYLAAITVGGSYSFNQCTFANYWPYGQRTTPSLFLNNYSLDNNNNPVPSDLTKADFKNSIIYGNIENEFETDSATTALFKYNFDHCILKVKSTTSVTDPLHYNILYINKDPNFISTSDGNFELDTLTAFAKDKGDPALIPLIPILHYDIKGVDRTIDLAPDLGAYERKD